jgi:heme a synthase
VGALITVMAGVSLWWRWQAPNTAPAAAPLTAPVSVGWPLFILAWVCLQGAFGAWTVTLKLYPAVVTAHLLGGIVLLVLLTVQHERTRMQPLALRPGLQVLGLCAALALLVQIALGGWVSTNYAVLACADFPTCRGQWWPDGLDFTQAFTLLRPLGRGADGGFLPVGALVAIHLVHRLCAVLTVMLMLALAWGLWRQGDARARRHARNLAWLLGLQVATGVSNIVLGWPLLAAVLHNGGAAGLALVMTRLAVQAWPAAQPTPVRRPTAAVASYSRHEAG